MIEIEKKFLLTSEQQDRLLENATLLNEKEMTDAYFDTPDHSLTLGDYWFRERDGAFELKAPLTSTSASEAKTNRYNEITDLDGIRQELNLPEGKDFTATLALASISSFVTCYTHRKSYEKDGFHIDIDEATYLDSDFHYSIAEIELLVANETQADEAEARIIAFAKQFSLTTDQPIIGKIGMYLKAEHPEHYQLLVDAGVF